MEFIILDPNNATEDQFVAALNYNAKTAAFMTKKIENLKTVAAATKKSSEAKVASSVTVNQPTSTEPEEEPFDENFENEFEYYYAMVEKISLDNIEEEMEEALPSKQNYQYQRILLRIKAEIKRNIKEIRELLLAEGAEEGEYFQDELDLEFRKLEIVSQKLTDYNSVDLEEREDETITNNTLIFVPTLGGDIRILEEIEDIDCEYYERFYGLFKSIKNGTFKNAKRFVSNSELAGLCEVKDFKVRVLFVRLNKDSYAVISAFVKKSDNDRAYRLSTTKKYEDYQAVEQSLIANLNNEEFMELNKSYEEELFRKLSPKQGKTIFKKKSGDES